MGGLALGSGEWTAPCPRLTSCGRCRGREGEDAEKAGELHGDGSVLDGGTEVLGRGVAVVGVLSLLVGGDGVGECVKNKEYRDPRGRGLRSFISTS